jgi:hypothetical protein
MCLRYGPLTNAVRGGFQIWLADSGIDQGVGVMWLYQKTLHGSLSENRY